MLAYAAAWLQASKKLINVSEYKPTSRGCFAVWTAPGALPQVQNASIIHFPFSGYETGIMFTFGHVSGHISATGKRLDAGRRHPTLRPHILTHPFHHKHQRAALKELPNRIRN